MACETTKGESNARLGELGFGEYTQGGLGRHLGVFSTILLIVGQIIGTGIFSTPSSITSSASSVGAALLLWIIGLFLAGSGLAVWLELCCMIPRSGGEKVYLGAAYRRPKLLITVSTEWEERGIAIAVISFIIFLHVFLPNCGVRGMNAIGVIRLVFLLFIVVIGWSNGAYVLNEIGNPVHTLKIAAPTGLGICGVLYLLANVAYYAAATPEEIANSGTTVTSYFMGMVSGKAAERAPGGSVLIAISAFGNVMTVTFAQARVNQELAKEGVIPFPTFWASSWLFGSTGRVAIFVMAGQAFQVVAPFIRPPGGKGDTILPYWLYPVVGIAVLVAGIVYWAVWQVLLPWVGGYKLVPEYVVLKDGTTVAV
ncbi:amino acid permease-domain-containing protein [Aspergillus fruticulosus]